MKEAPAIALVLPPLGQLNAPYPSTAYLARHLRSCGVACTQRDLGIELALRLYSRAGLAEVFDALEARDDVPDAAWRALALRRQHEGCIDAVIAFLQRRDGTVAPRILDTPFLPRTPRLLEPDLDGFGPLGVDDTARHLATLYLSDLADLVALVDPDFALSRYGHRLAVGAHSFDAIAARLDATTLVDRHVDALADTLVAPVVGISIPFPGQLLAALRIGRRLRARGTYVVVGGGYVNTELRTFTDLRPGSASTPCASTTARAPSTRSSPTARAGRIAATGRAPARASTTRRTPTCRRRSRPGTATSTSRPTSSSWTGRTRRIASGRTGAGTR